MIYLPRTTRRWPLIRLVARSWGTTTWNAWRVVGEIRPPNATKATPGLVLDHWLRSCLPQIGEASFRWEFGRINGTLYDWSTVPDLRGNEIRIQIAPGVDNPLPGSSGGTVTPEWRTAWWGTVETQSDDATAGVRAWHCFDGLARARSWRLTRHHAYVDGAHYQDCRGFPGYNLPLGGWYARVLGNRAPGSVTQDWWGDLGGDPRTFAFTWPGNGVAWTDRAVVEHALQTARGKGDPVFRLMGQTALLDAGVRAWPVADGTDAWSVAAQVCDRRRGRGLVFVDWADDVAAPLGPLDVYLTVRPQFAADITWTPPGGTQATAQGATAGGTARAIDVAGDQRLVSGSLVLSTRLSTRYDWVESVGEPIEVLATLSMRRASDKSLAKRWTTADETAFAAITNPLWRSTSRWDPVYQRFGLPLTWGWIAEDGNGTEAMACRCDYRCGDNGAVIAPTSSGSGDPPTASPLTARILPDLPLYEGWNYGVLPPVRFDGSTEWQAPPRRPLLALARTGDDRYLDLRRIGFNAQLDPGYGLLISYGPDQDDRRATRWFSGIPALGGAQPPDQLVLTVGLQLGERVRMASGDTSGRRRLRIEHRGLHLWLAHPGAIWDLDRATSAIAEAPGKRQAAGATVGAPGILRDDRTYLAQLHALTCAWYLADHITATWSLRDCGCLPSFEAATSSDGTPTAIAYARLGDLVTEITWRDRAGLAHASPVATPVTSIAYDHRTGTTTWTTDWAELDTE